ncbi:hemolysin family protein [Synoicihabitans lomoniglobus]|uniref:Hemolysin family protein n=1 Tax=Synoicihabitans lomoniglobus TaxID=2909285 RepID=A0AAF0CP92_9BACT|nr:hemolysin family protein [Opitutaceae bacterium LMO-M01]WED63619.1 hemolysin family protein [Opitutaceae bacterium LMO-M01]
MLLNLIVVAALVVANGFFVAAEFALVKVRVGELKAQAAGGHGKAVRALSIHQNLDTYLSACQLGITLASLGLGWVGEPMVASSLEPLLLQLGIAIEWHHYIAFPVAFTAITFLHITLGEQVPKIYAIAKSHAVTLHVSHPLHWFTVAFKPFIWALNALSNSMLRVIGFDTEELHGGALNAAELKLLLRESKDGGHVSNKEHKMIVNVLDLEAKSARRYAVPRHTVVFLDLNESFAENLAVANRSQHTRLPLCDGGLDKCVGVIHVKDLFQQLAEQKTPHDLRALARPVSLLPETIKLQALLAHFQKKKEHLVLLVDEFGSVSGIITIENVLEEVVGAIEDEFDHEVGFITLLNAQEAEARGSCPIDHLCRAFNLPPRETEADTVAGYITELMQRIPHKGESVRDADFAFTITEATASTVVRVKIALLVEG